MNRLEKYRTELVTKVHGMDAIYCKARRMGDMKLAKMAREAADDCAHELKEVEHMLEVEYARS